MGSRALAVPEGNEIMDIITDEMAERIAEFDKKRDKQMGPLARYANEQAKIIRKDEERLKRMKDEAGILFLRAHGMAAKIGVPINDCIEVAMDRMEILAEQEGGEA